MQGPQLPFSLRHRDARSRRNEVRFNTSFSGHGHHFSRGRNICDMLTLSRHSLDTTKRLFISFQEPSTFTFASSNLVFAVVPSDRPVKCLQKHQAHATPWVHTVGLFDWSALRQSFDPGRLHWVDLIAIVASQETSSYDSRLLR